MTDIPTSMAEALNEIASMGRRIRELEAIIAGNSATVARGVDAELADQDARDDELRRLRVRIMEYEARAAVTLGTLEQPTDDEPATITHNIPPSAPPHDER